MPHLLPPRNSNAGSDGQHSFAPDHTGGKSLSCGQPLACDPSAVQFLFWNGGQRKNKPHLPFSLNQPNSCKISPLKSREELNRIQRPQVSGCNFLQRPQVSGCNFLQRSMNWFQLHLGTTDLLRPSQLHLVKQRLQLSPPQLSEP